MSFNITKVILLFIFYIFDFSKSDDQLSKKDSLRFLNEPVSLKRAYTKTKFEADELSIIDRIRDISPHEVLSKLADNENKAFNVRCFWVDLETLRVYDLIKLKTKK